MPPIPNEQTAEAPGTDPTVNPAAGVEGAAATEAAAEDAGGEGGDGAAPDAAASAEGDGDAAGAGADQVDKPEGEVQPYEGLVAPPNTTLHADDMAAAAPLMRSLGIQDGEQAQAFIDGAAPIIEQISNRVVDQMTTQMAENRANLHKEWHDQLRADPKIGGAHYDETMAMSALARDKLFPETFNTFLDESGLGNHPDFIAGMRNIGLQLKEDTIIVPTQTTAPKPGDNLYDPAYSPKS